jgi:hypothetical protein
MSNFDCQAQEKCIATKEIQIEQSFSIFHESLKMSAADIMSMGNGGRARFFMLISF